jgi:L-seryl-tRNA(Ser) seleniumtransferase
MMTVHFVGLPPGTSALMIKFIPPETLARFGGPQAYARAVDDALTKLASMIADSEKIRRLLFGGSPAGS